MPKWCILQSAETPIERKSLMFKTLCHPLIIRVFAS